MTASVDDVRRLALDLPGVSERYSWGQPAWFTGTLLARMWDDDTLTVKAEPDEREAMLAGDPDRFFTTAHHDGTNLVLVRLAAIGLDELAELVEESWRIAGGRR